MNKAELIAAVAAAAEISKKDAEIAVTATLDTITAALKEGDKVQLVGFGSFEVKSRAARTGRNHSCLNRKSGHAHANRHDRRPCHGHNSQHCTGNRCK